MPFKDEEIVEFVEAVIAQANDELVRVRRRLAAKPDSPETKRLNYRRRQLREIRDGFTAFLASQKLEQSILAGEIGWPLRDIDGTYLPSYIGTKRNGYRGAAGL